MASKEELHTHQLTEVAVEEINIDEIQNDVQMAVPAPEIQEGTDKEPESEFDTISTSETKATKAADATRDEAAEITATETSEATAAEAQENMEEKEENTAGSTANTNSPVAIIQAPQDAAISKQAVAEMTAPEEETQHKLEEHAKEVVLSDKVEADVERPEEFDNLEAAATDDAPAEVALDATVGVEGTNELTGEKVEPLAPKVAPTEATPDATVGVEDTNEEPKEEDMGEKVEPLASEVVPTEATPDATISVEGSNEVTGEKVEPSAPNVAPAEATPDATVGVKDTNEETKEENMGEKVELLASEVVPTEATPDATIGVDVTNEARKEENTCERVESLTSEVRPTEVAPDATAGIEDTNEAPKEENTGEKVESLASEIAPMEATPNATDGMGDMNEAPKEEFTGKKVDELASSIVTETKAIDPSSVTTPAEETDASSVTVTEPKTIEGTQIKDKQEVSNVKKDQAKVGKSSNGEEEVPTDLDTSTIDVVEAPSNSEDKALEAEVEKEENKNESSSHTETFTEVAAVPGVVEGIKRKTLEGLLLAEKSTWKLATEEQSTVPPQEEKPEDPNGNAESDENVVTNDGDLLETTKAAKDTDTDVKNPTTTEEEPKEPVVKGTEAAVEDMKETKERDEAEAIMDAEEEIIGKTESNPAKPSQRHSNNIMSKVKQSIVKVKKAIIGKSPSSKTITSPTDKDDIKVR